VNDEAGVYRQRALRRIDSDRLGVAAEARLAFEYADFVLTA
jgi:hypothetical protein